MAYVTVGLAFASGQGVVAQAKGRGFAHHFQQADMVARAFAIAAQQGAQREDHADMVVQAIGQFGWIAVVAQVAGGGEQAVDQGDQIVLAAPGHGFDRGCLDADLGPETFQSQSAVMMIPFDQGDHEARAGQGWNGQKRKRRGWPGQRGGEGARERQGGRRDAKPDDMPLAAPVAVIDLLRDLDEVGLEARHPSGLAVSQRAVGAIEAAQGQGLRHRAVVFFDGQADGGSRWIGGGRVREADGQAVLRECRQVEGLEGLGTATVDKGPDLAQGLQGRDCGIVRYRCACFVEVNDEAVGAITEVAEKGGLAVETGSHGAFLAWRQAVSGRRP